MKKGLILVILLFQVGLAQGVNNSALLNFKDNVSVTVTGNYTHNDVAQINLEAGTVLNIEGSITDNGGSVSGDGEIYLNGVDVYGCTDPFAINYNSEAYWNDGSCYHDVLTDIDGNEYQAVQIGEQLWMKENLKVNHYRNGDELPDITDGGDWSNLSTGAYCNYNNNDSMAETYGHLYNWHAVNDSRNIAPDGWHVPSDEEFMELEMYLNMSESEANSTGWRGTNEGSKLAGNAGLWDNGDLENNSEFGTSGFSAFPAGYRYYYDGSYYGMGNFGYFWSSSELYSFYAWSRLLSYSNSDVSRNLSLSYKLFGFSVRCLKD